MYKAHIFTTHGHNITPGRLLTLVMLISTSIFAYKLITELA